MKTLSSTVVIHVTDLNRALAYYTTILGFTEDFKFEAYAGLFLDQVNIHLSGPNNPGMHKMPGATLFCIEVDDVDTYFNTILPKGALIATPLEDRYYGLRDFAVNDHDGNTLVFGSTIADAS